MLELNIEVPVFSSADGADNPMRMAERFGVPYLGSIPLDSNLVVGAAFLSKCDALIFTLESL